MIESRINEWKSEAHAEEVRSVTVLSGKPAGEYEIVLSISTEVPGQANGWTRVAAEKKFSTKHQTGPTPEGDMHYSMWQLKI